MRYAGHSHVAVAPGLAGCPLHRFVDVLNRLRIDVSEDAAGLVRSGNVDDEQRVTAANVEIEVARFHEAASVGETDRHQFHRLRRLGVGVNRKQGGKFSWRVRPENIRVERHSVSNRNGDVALDRDSVLSRRGLPLRRKHFSSSKPFPLQRDRARCVSFGIQ